jgi:hypothetical protein
MRNVILVLSLFVLFVTTQSVDCHRPIPSSCEKYKSDSVLLAVSVTNPALQYHLFDTIWLTSFISDTYTPLSGSPVSFTRATEQLFMSIQPYSINTSGSLPLLQYANIEFNPVVTDGSLSQFGYNGYNFQYRRLATNNSLGAGLVAGRTGLYLVELNPSSYVNNPFYIYNTTDFCTTYYGVATVPATQQNSSYWTGLGVTAMSTSPAYGNHTVSKSMRNYLIFRVVP